jgi:hypothetical protein
LADVISSSRLCGLSANGNTGYGAGAIGPFPKPEIGKGKEHFFFFRQAFAGFWVFDLVTGDKLIVNDLTAIDNGRGPSTGLFSFRHRSVPIS